jgi:hypothetical protein
LYKSFKILILVSVVLSFGFVTEINAMGSRNRLPGPSLPDPAPMPTPPPSPEPDPVTVEVDPVFSAHPSKKITEADISNIRTDKPEADPVFDVSPARSISAEDVYNIKNIDTVVGDKITEVGSSEAIPVLSAAPENPLEGMMFLSRLKERPYIYICQDIAGQKYCKWKAVSGNNSYYDSYHEPIGILPKLTLSLTIPPGIPPGVVDALAHREYWDCCNYQVEFEVSDGGNPLPMETSNYILPIYLVRVSEDPYQQTGPWNWDNERLPLYKATPWFESFVISFAQKSATTFSCTMLSAKNSGQQASLAAGCYGVMVEVITKTGEKSVAKLPVIFSLGM